MKRTANGNRAGRPRDARFGGDAVHFLLVRLLLLGWARVGTLVVLDLAAVGVALAAAWAGGGGEGALGGWRLVVPLMGYSVVLSIAVAGGYGAGEAWRRPARVAAAALSGWVAVLALLEVVGWLGPRSRIALAGLGAAGLLVVARLLAAGAVRRMRHRGRLTWRVVVVGDADSTAALGPRLGEARAAGLIVAGRVGAGGEAESDAARVMGELEEALDRGRVDAVVVTSTLGKRTLEGVLSTSFRHGVAVHLVPVTLADVACRVRPHLLFECPAMEVRPVNLPAPPMTMKRVLDVVLAALALVALAPVLVLIAAAIKLDSPGPVLFGQMRAGVGGHPFRMWKFRTMHRDADRWKSRVAHLNGSQDPRLFKVVADPRITRVGRWLRRTSLDELPQLFNVLRGEMSLVGPRPFFPEDLALYEPHHFERLTVLPGITGLWQVSGRSEIRDFDAVVNLDREYIQRWSLGLDMEILLKTIPAVFRRDGAY